MTDLDGPVSRDMVCKVTSVEVALERTDREDKLRILDLFLDLWVADGTDIDLFNANEPLRLET